MDIEQNISITESTTAANTLNDLSGREAAEKQQQDRNVITENIKSYFKPWRVFINHIDSYHGKMLVDVLSDAVYVDPRSARVKTLPDKEGEELGEENEGDEQAEDEEEEKRKSPDNSAEVSRKYEVIGTVLDQEYSCPDNVTMIIRHSDDKNLLLSELMSCGIIIYDITQETNQIEEASWILKKIVCALKCAEEKSSKIFEQQEPIRYFMLISTIMTWALTKPLDPADPSLPFTEADYRKRKPHPNYKEHIRCERELITVKKHANLKSKLKTLVICCGVTYGEEEGPLHYLFKMAWQLAPFLPIFGEGHNKIPLLHVRDFAAIVLAILQNWPKKKYIVAVERELISQNIIVKEIGQRLGTNNVKNLTKEEALLLPDVSQCIYDQMTVDLNIDPVYIIDRIRWKLPFRDIINEIIKEYKSARNLRPVKIVVLGPPASGKTRVARYLADHYGIQYIHVKTLISITMDKTVIDIKATESGGEQRDDLEDTAEDDNDKEDQEKAEEEEEVEEQDEKEVIARTEELQEQLDEIRNNLAVNNDRLDDVVLNKLFLSQLLSKGCLNQGYVIDGYPKTLKQARMLFLISEENFKEEEQIEQIENKEDEFEDEDTEFEDEDTEMKNVNVTILPELVVVLEASDEFLKERIMNLPESEIRDTHYTEQHMLRRMKEYRERNMDDNTPLQLFDEMEIYSLVISVEADICPDMFPTVYQCLEILGKPRNYGPTADEIKARQKLIEAEARAAEAAEKLRQEREMLERERQREEKIMEWTRLTEKLKQEEEERLCVLAEPLRHYLATYVLPTLTEALIEVAKLRPEDPIDFLAEYLFKKNPEGRMFEPDYTETMSMLLDAISRQQNDILPMEGLYADVEQFIKSQDELFSTAGETEKSEDECREISSTSIPG